MSQQKFFEELIRSKTLPEIQLYIKKVIEIRGFSNQSAEANMLLLVEEVGELAKAMRKDISGMSVDKTMLYRYDTVENEVADVLIVLISICNTLDIDLFDALVKKEEINIERNWTVNQEIVT